VAGDDEEQADGGGVEPVTTSAPPVTTFGAGAGGGDGGGDDGGDGWNPKAQGERRRPTTAEQAVPWLIGLILALTGIVIVLMALIFTAPGGLASLIPSGSGDPSMSPLPSLGSSSAAPSASRAASASSSPTTAPTAAPTQTPPPVYGPLEMVYLGRPSAVAPVYLLRRDFSTAGDPTIVTQAADGVTRYAWAPDGTVGAAIIGGRAVSVTPGQSARTLADSVSAISFGWDAETVYAVRILRDGANDRADILEIDFVSGGTKTLSSVTYPHPVISADPALREAQFIDDGGTVRIYAVADGNLTVWILGAPAVYQVDPGDGTQAEVSREPILWSPDGTHRITLAEGGSSTVLGYRNRSGDAETSVRVTGLVSHVRWAGTSNEIVFTLGYVTSAGGVRQDLYVWDLVDGKAPLPLTSNGTSFGAEWLGVMPNWLP
jgi:hypothetical protein